MPYGEFDVLLVSSGRPLRVGHLFCASGLGVPSSSVALGCHPWVFLPAGALMLVAWVAAVSIGVIVARFFKPVLSRPVFGEAAWFQVGGGKAFTQLPCHRASPREDR